MGRLKTPLRTLHQPAFTCAPANATPVLRDDRTPVPVFSWKAEGDVSLGFGAGVAGLGFVLPRGPGSGEGAVAHKGSPPLLSGVELGGCSRGAWHLHSKQPKSYRVNGADHGLRTRILDPNSKGNSPQPNRRGLGRCGSGPLSAATRSPHLFRPFHFFSRLGLALGKGPGFGNMDGGR